MNLDTKRLAILRAYSDTERSALAAYLEHARQGGPPMKSEELREIWIDEATKLGAIVEEIVRGT